MIDNEMELPHRPPARKRGRHQRRYEILELCITGRLGQIRRYDVLRDIERGIVAPSRAGCRLLSHLPEAAEHEEPLANDGAKPRERQPALERQHAADHHQIRGPIHSQPRGIDSGNVLALAHRNLDFALGVGRRAFVACAFAFALK